MAPTLADGDRLLVSYAAAPAAGDVVLARFADGTLAVKRAVEPRLTRSGDRGWWLLSDNTTRASTPATGARWRTSPCWPSSDCDCGLPHAWCDADGTARVAWVSCGRIGAWNRSRTPSPVTRSSTCISAARWRRSRRSR
ncbi:S24/S26 family peptidase [Nocardioides sp.]|uniref:S24/S26 family peptidase n=1 Tax=Nocardioides sp. TaxID=35761 RepID=UPI00286E6C24|nr:S24/S26 family peptidase [Nocardioides sp.]